MWESESKSGSRALGKAEERALRQAQTTGHRVSSWEVEALCQVHSHATWECSTLSTGQLEQDSKLSGKNQRRKSSSGIYWNTEYLVSRHWMKMQNRKCLRRKLCYSCDMIMIMFLPSHSCLRGKEKKGWIFNKAVSSTKMWAFIVDVENNLL